MRGENYDAVQPGKTFIGTSPRARGKLKGFQPYKPWGRNIPACAGKTQRTSHGFHMQTEHPRVRGENENFCLYQLVRIGTSPRARGKQFSITKTDFEARNIPACAGKTCTKSRVVSRATEHPRVRGENCAFELLKHDVPGTSPRARGKR